MYYGSSLVSFYDKFLDHQSQFLSSQGKEEPEKKKTNGKLYDDSGMCGSSFKFCIVRYPAMLRCMNCLRTQCFLKTMLAVFFFLGFVLVSKQPLL